MDDGVVRIGMAAIAALWFVMMSTMLISNARRAVPGRREALERSAIRVQLGVAFSMVDASVGLLWVPRMSGDLFLTPTGIHFESGWWALTASFAGPPPRPHLLVPGEPRRELLQSCSAAAGRLRLSLHRSFGGAVLWVTVDEPQAWVEEIERLQDLARHGDCLVDLPDGRAIP